VSQLTAFSEHLQNVILMLYVEQFHAYSQHTADFRGGDDDSGIVAY